MELTRKNQIVILVTLVTTLLSVSFSSASYDNGLYMLYQNWSVPVNSQDMTYHNQPDIFSSGGAYSSTAHVLNPDWNALQGGLSFTSQIWYVQNPVYIPIEDGFTVALLWDPADDGGTATDVVGYGPHIGTYAPQFPAGASFLIRRRRLPSGELFNTGQELEAFLRLNDSVCSGLFSFPSDYFTYPISLDIFSYSTTTGNFTCEKNGVSCGTISCSGAPVNVSASNYIGMGGIAQGGGLASGKYYQFIVWNRELDATEKSGLYNSGSFLALNQTYAPYDPANWVRKNITTFSDYYDHISWNNPIYASLGRIHDMDDEGSSGKNDVFLVSDDFGMIYFKNINNTWPLSDDFITIDATYTSVGDDSLELGYDVNNDTCEDIIFIGPYSQPPRWLEGHCNGTYDSVRTLPNSFDGPFTEYFNALGVGDIDDDGDIDIFSDTSISSIRYIFWWENDGLGNFTQYNIKNITSIPHSISVVDWNYDGIQDVVVGGSDFVCHFLTNDGNEQFTWTTQADCGQILSFADINEDLYPDILAVQSSAGTVWQENNGGTGSWTKHIINNNNGAFGARAVAEDVNFDYKLDVFSIDGTYRFVHSINNGTGYNWSGPYEMLQPNNWDFYNEWGGQYYDIEFGDITGDGINEIVVAGEFPFIFFNENEVSPSYSCVPNWVCSSYTACNSSDLQVCTGVTDSNACGQTYSGDYSEYPPNACDYCTPSWACSEYSASCGIEDNYPCINATDSNSCYAQTGLPSDSYTGDYSEFAGNGTCDYCTPSWYCDNDLCEDTNYGTRCLMTNGFWRPQYCQTNDLYICSDTAVKDSNLCYSQTGLPSDQYADNPIIYQNVTCNYCTPSVSFSDYQYPLNEYCVDGTQNRTFTNTNWGACCDATGITEDCVVQDYIGTRDLDFTSTNIIQDSLACESQFWFDSDIVYYDVDQPYSYWWVRQHSPLYPYTNEWIMNVTTLASTYRYKSEFNGASYSGYRLGLRVEQTDMTIPNYWWYYSSAPTDTKTIWTYGYIYDWENGNTDTAFNLTPNSTIQMTINRANRSVTFLSLQDKFGRNGVYLPITVDGDLTQNACDNAYLFGGEENNTNNIVCCDYGRSLTNTTYDYYATIGDLEAACPTLDSTHYTDLKIIQFKSHNGSYLGDIENLTILPYAGYNIQSNYNQKPIITSVDRSTTQYSIPVGTTVDFNINSVDPEGSPMQYYVVCDYSPSQETQNWYSYGFWEVTTTGGIDAQRNQPVTPSASNQLSCTFNSIKDYTVRVYTFDEGMKIKQLLTEAGTGLVYEGWSLPFPSVMRPRIVEYYTLNQDYAVYDEFTYTTRALVCGDSNCDSGFGENYLTCPADCNSYCGDGLCNPYEENGDTCPADCTGGGGYVPAPAQKEEQIPDYYMCSPGFEYDGAKEGFITEYEDITVPYYLRELTSKQTCGIDADQDGIMCDLNEDFISCSQDCKFNLAEFMCVNTQKCMWTEQWFLQIIFIIQLMVAMYLIYLVMLV